MKKSNISSWPLQNSLKKLHQQHRFFGRRRVNGPGFHSCVKNQRLANSCGWYCRGNNDILHSCREASRGAFVWHGVGTPDVLSISLVCRGDLLVVMLVVMVTCLSTWWSVCHHGDCCRGGLLVVMINCLWSWWPVNVVICLSSFCCHGDMLVVMMICLWSWWPVNVVICLSSQW